MDEHRQKLLNFKQLNFGKNNHFSSAKKLTDPTCFNYNFNHNFQKINIKNKRNKHKFLNPFIQIFLLSKATS